MTKMTKEQIENINSAAELLDNLGYNTPPFNPFQIAEELGIEIDQSVTTETISRSGSICIINGKPRIWVNPFDPDVRQRFTAAHELGHYVNGDLKSNSNIVDTPDTLYRTDGHSNPCEVKANKFAAQLLMPKKHIYDKAKELINQSGGSVDSGDFIREMAQIFGVSKPTMLYRLKGFGIVSSSYLIRQKYKQE